MRKPFLHKHVSGYWYIYYYDNGKRRSVTTETKLKTLANDALRDFKPELIGSPNKDLKKLECEVLEYARVNVKPEMFRQYKTVWKNFIDFSQNKPLVEIDKNNIANYIRYRQGLVSRTGKPYSSSALNLELAILKRSFEIAVDKNWLSVNPARKLKKKPITERVPEFTLPEIDLLLAELKALPDIKYYNAVKIALNTGMRRGEICGLLWADIDLKKREIYLKNKINKKPEFVTINQSVYDILTSIPINIDGKVFDIQENYLYEVVKKCIKKLGLNPKLRFHSLRHTYITEAVNKYGIHIGQDLARHSSISMTAKYYHSKRDEIKAKAMGMDL